jgi:hypothetical protein
MNPDENCTLLTYVLTNNAHTLTYFHTLFLSTTCFNERERESKREGGERDKKRGIVEKSEEGFFPVKARILPEQDQYPSCFIDENIKSKKS